MVAVARAAERGGGIALVPSVVCEPWFERGALVRLDGFDLQGNDAYYLMARRDDFERSEVRALVDWWIEQFQRSRRRRSRPEREVCSFIA